MALHRDRQAGFETRIRHITAAGIQLPPEVETLRDRLRSFQQYPATGMREALAAAVAEGDTDSIPSLYAGALAEEAASPPMKAAVAEAVRAHINRAIRDAYGKMAEQAYRTLADEFDTAATRFTTAAKVCDPEADPAVVIAQSDKIRTAWQAAGAAVEELNRLLRPLHDAAVLAGVCGDDAEEQLRLVVDGQGCDPAALREAWTVEEREAKSRRARQSGSVFTTGDTPPSRTGRWGAVLSTGAQLRALRCDTLATA